MSLDGNAYPEHGFPLLDDEQALVNLVDAAGGNISVLAWVATGINELCAEPRTHWDVPTARPD